MCFLFFPRQIARERLVLKARSPEDQTEQTPMIPANESKPTDPVVNRLN